MEEYDKIKASGSFRTFIKLPELNIEGMTNNFTLVPGLGTDPGSKWASVLLIWINQELIPTVNAKVGGEHLHPLWEPQMKDLYPVELPESAIGDTNYIQYEWTKGMLYNNLPKDKNLNKTMDGHMWVENLLNWINEILIPTVNEKLGTGIELPLITHRLRFCREEVCCIGDLEGYEKLGYQMKINANPGEPWAVGKKPKAIRKKRKKPPEIREGVTEIASCPSLLQQWFNDQLKPILDDKCEISDLDMFYKEIKDGIGTINKLDHYKTKRQIDDDIDDKEREINVALEAAKNQLLERILRDARGRDWAGANTRLNIVTESFNKLKKDGITRKEAEDILDELKKRLKPYGKKLKALYIGLRALMVNLFS